MLRAFGLISGARVASTAAQAGTLLVMARHLGPAGFGGFAAVLGGLMALGILADGGATYAVGRHHTDPATIVQVLRAGRVLSAATLLVSVPVLAVLAQWPGSVVPAACLLLCGWLPLERQCEVNSAYLLARGRDGVVGAAYLLRRLPTLAAVLLLPATPVLAFSATMLATAAGAAVLLGRGVGAEVGAGRRAAAWAVGLPDRWIWPVLRPYWLAITGQGVRQLDVAVLGLTAGAPAAGVFAPASRLGYALLLVPGTYNQLLLARLSATRERLTARTVLTVGLAGAATFLPLAVFADLWVPLLLGPAYGASVDVVRIVTAGCVLASLCSVFASALHAADRAGRVAVAAWIGAGTTIALVTVLGAAHGAVGAGWAVVAGYGIQLLLVAGLHRSLDRRPVADPAARERQSREWA